MDNAFLRSPVTLSNNIMQVDSINCDWLIRAYRRELNMDVSEYFGALDQIHVFQCADTGYRFFVPFSIAGNAAFYATLQENSWYYMDWKWEHEICLRYLRPGMRVLEIGCGAGGFLQRVGKGGIGLELNEQAAVQARTRGLTVLSETVEDHARSHTASYDAVCSFQVLEHVSRVREFVRSSVDALRIGGVLVISVPNNDSFMFREFKPILNYPPHHMGLWSVNSLLGLQKIADIRVEAVFLEPLQPYHLGYGKDFLNKQLSNVHANIVQQAAAKLERIFLHALPPLEEMAGASAAAMAQYLPGHSVLMVFRKAG